MKIEDLRELLRDKKVVEEINKHLWSESQKAGYSIGIERATDEWLRLYAMGWMKYNMPEKYGKVTKKKKDKTKKKVAAKTVKKLAEKKTVKKVVKKVAAKKTVKKVVKKKAAKK